MFRSMYLYQLAVRSHLWSVAALWSFRWLPRRSTVWLMKRSLRLWHRLDQLEQAC